MGNHRWSVQFHIFSSVFDYSHGGQFFCSTRAKCSESMRPSLHQHDPDTIRRIVQRSELQTLSGELYHARKSFSLRKARWIPEKNEHEILWKRLIAVPPVASKSLARSTPNMLAVKASNRQNVYKCMVAYVNTSCFKSPRNSLAFEHSHTAQVVCIAALLLSPMCYKSSLAGPSWSDLQKYPATGHWGHCSRAKAISLLWASCASQVLPVFTSQLLVLLVLLVLNFILNIFP